MKSTKTHPKSHRHRLDDRLYAEILRDTLSSECCSFCNEDVAESMLLTSLNSILIWPKNVRHRESDQLSDLAQGSSAHNLLLMVASDFPGSSILRMFQPMVAVLMNYLRPHEAYSILRMIAIRGNDPADFVFLTPNQSWIDWAVYRLLRRLPTASESDIRTFVEFLLDGGAFHLKPEQYRRLVSCFIVEGSKVLVRLGIAFIAFPHLLEKDDELFKKAFGLRISRKSYPLSTRKAEWLRKRFPAWTPGIEYEISVPPIDSLIDLKPVLPFMLEALAYPLISVTHRQVIKVFDSSADGTSCLTFLKTVTGELSEKPFMLLLVVLTKEDPVPVVLAMTTESAALFKPGDPDRKVFRLSTESDRVVRKFNDSLVFVSSEDSAPIMSFYHDMSRLTVPDLQIDELIIRYEIIRIH